MKSVNEVIDDMQSRGLANEIIFQSLFSALPEELKAKVLANIEQNFAAFDGGTVDENAKKKLAAAKIFAKRVSGANI